MHVKTIREKRRKNGGHTLSGFQTLGLDTRLWPSWALPTYLFQCVHLSLWCLLGALSDFAWEQREPVKAVGPEGENKEI